MAYAAVKDEQGRGFGKRFLLKLIDQTATSATFDIPINPVMLAEIAKNNGYLRVSVAGRDYAKLRGLRAVQ